jgi:molybdopterin converting factor subunit 1
MIIRALFFAHLQELAGSAEKTYDLDDNATVGEFARHLASIDIRFNDVLRYARAAVNGEWATAGTKLQDGDEIGLLPPSSGG